MGTVNSIAPDVRAGLKVDEALRSLWQGLTPLGRNEFLCWSEDAKRPETRARYIARTIDRVREGKRRPCCWPGCVHRPDKPPTAAQLAVLRVGRPGSQVAGGGP